eukprot:TRINITY_DN8585_c3_g1_i2.p1 TRINITY_DN8585_c3_g1~~TRINITY_DN8585_c3_g1_i2.p1  ORF type:complete len:466 (+),score=216.67 TRINITY_DN8585_c3_g1_i2:72-1400(+)
MALDGSESPEDPFLAALKQGGKRGRPKVSLFDFGGSRPITSPRSVEACRACGCRPDQLLVREERHFAAEAESKEQRKRLADRWEEQRHRHLRACMEKYAQLEQEAREVLRREGQSAVEVALREREARQRERTAHLQEVKRMQQEKSLREQMQADQDREAAMKRVKEKEEQVERKREERRRRQEQEAEQKAELAARRLDAVSESAARLAEMRKQRQVQREEQSRLLQTRLRERREREAAEREARELQRLQEMEEKRERCIAEERARVVSLLTKRQAKEDQLSRLLDERDARVREKADALAMRNAEIREHVDKLKLAATYERDRSLRRLAEKGRRAGRLVDLKRGMVQTQRNITAEDREKRHALNMWMASAKVTGDYSVPPWVRIELGEAADERSLAALINRLGEQFPAFDAKQVARSAAAPKPWAAPLIQPQQKQHHSRWVWD